MVTDIFECLSAIYRTADSNRAGARGVPRGGARRREAAAGAARLGHPAQPGYRGTLLITN